MAVNTRLMQDEIAHILGHAKCRLLVVDESLEPAGSEAARAAGAERVLVCGGSHEAFLAT